MQPVESLVEWLYSDEAVSVRRVEDRWLDGKLGIQFEVKRALRTDEQGLHFICFEDGRILYWEIGNEKNWAPAESDAEMRAVTDVMRQCLIEKHKPSN